MGYFLQKSKGYNSIKGKIFLFEKNLQILYWTYQERWGGLSARQGVRHITLDKYTNKKIKMMQVVFDFKEEVKCAMVE